MIVVILFDSKIEQCKEETSTVMFYSKAERVEEGLERRGMEGGKRGGHANNKTYLRFTK
jgi:hypothetical protein